MQGTLAWPLEHAARPHDNKLAVIDGARQLTYRELHERVRRLGAGFDAGWRYRPMAEYSIR